MTKCPIKRLEKILKIGNLVKEKISKKIEKEVEKTINFAKNSPYPKGTELAKDVFKV